MQVGNAFGGKMLECSGHHLSSPEITSPDGQVSFNNTIRNVRAMALEVRNQSFEMSNSGQKLPVSTGVYKAAHDE
jgi:hypothetical protein